MNFDINGIVRVQRLYHSNFHGDGWYAPYLITLDHGFDCRGRITGWSPQTRAVMDDYGFLVVVREWR